MRIFETIFLIIFLLICSSTQTIAQTFCVYFEETNDEFNGTNFDDAIFYSESDIDFRFKSGWLTPELSFIRIQPLPSWSGIYGSDNFSGNKLHWQEAYTHVLLNNLPIGIKSIRFDLNSYGEKILMEDIVVWGQGVYSIDQDTNTLINGTIVEIVGDIDSIAFGAAYHNDYVIDNFCVDVQSANLNEISNLKYQVFPNPTSGFLSIDFEENQTQIDFIFYNATGEIVEQRKQQNFLSAKFQLQFEPGVYFLEITNDRFEKSVLKIIKE